MFSLRLINATVRLLKQSVVMALITVSTKKDISHGYSQMISVKLFTFSCCFIPLFNKRCEMFS